MVPHLGHSTEVALLPIRNGGLGAFRVQSTYKLLGINCCPHHSLTPFEAMSLSVSLLHTW